MDRCDVNWRSRESREAWMKARREVVYRQILERRGVPGAYTMPASEVFAHERPVDCWSKKHGPAHWGLLHRRALKPVTDPEAELDWLKGAYADGIKCPRCKAHWMAMLATYPPALADYFSWSVERHNDVNLKIGKPPMTLEDAKARWTQL